jgi:hypothetical protein
MRSLWAFMFALPICFGAGLYTAEYCKRHAKDTLDDRQFHLAGVVLCLQWDTSDTAPRVSTSTSGHSVVGIRSDTREELIDSAGADDGARDSSMDARCCPVRKTWM